MVEVKNTKKYFPQITQIEIPSLISNDLIYSKIKKGYKIPFRGTDGKYHVLYKTVNTINGKVYIGVRSCIDIDNDTYLGAGVDKGIYFEKNERSNFKNALLKYGRGNFIRQNLSFYTTRKLAFLDEKNVVDLDWKLNENTNYNICIGGSSPPTGKGFLNSNYGKKWSDEKKRSLSDYFKINRDQSNSNNPRAVKCYIYNIFTKELIVFGSAKEGGEFLGFGKRTMPTLFSKVSELSKTVRKEKYIIFREEDYILRVNNNTLTIDIENIINNSHSRKKILNKLNNDNS